MNALVVLGVLGGYLQLDARMFAGNDQFYVRAARPELKGTIEEHFDYRLLADFAGGKATLQDAYVDVRYSELVKVRFGKFKVPFGLERLQRDIYTTFAERGLPSLLTPNRDVGVQVFGDAGPVEYEAGVFDGVADNASADTDTSNHKTGVARVFVHVLPGLGIGAAGTLGWERGTPAPVYVTQAGTTLFAFPDGTVSIGEHWRASAQGYYYRGPFGVLGEYVRSVQHVPARAESDAWQGVAQWVITGEDASYTSVVPAHCYGAFDIAARYGELRAAGAAPARSFGAGIDWFANKQIRAVLDLEHTWHVETSVIGRVQAVF